MAMTRAYRSRGGLTSLSSTWRFLVCLWWLLQACQWALVDSKGKGPIFVWPASPTYVMIADSSYPGIVVVDVKRGVATERFSIGNVNGNRAVGVYSCLECTYVLHSAGKDRLFRIHLHPSKGRIRDVLEESEPNFFEGASVELLLNATGARDGIDIRMMVLQRDGQRAYVASSSDRTVYKINLLKLEPKFTPVFMPKKGMPFGVTLDHNDRHLLVTMHHDKIYRITRKGKIKNLHELVEENGCPPALIDGKPKQPNLREAFDDPLYPQQAILVLASQSVSYDAAVWRLFYRKPIPEGLPQCEIIAGRIGYDSGWVDAVGKDIRFSRPHGMAIMPLEAPDEHPKLLLTDVDNRALRMLDLVSLESWSIMYDRDVRALEFPAGALKSPVDCFDAAVAADFSLTESIYHDFSIAEPPQVSDLTFAEAAAHCANRGLRLCDPSELRKSQVAPNDIVWTMGECASCYQRNTSSFCNATIQTFRTPGVHSTPGFQHSWNNGVAYEVGANLDKGPATICHSLFSNPPPKEFRAAAACCADC